MTDHDRGGGEAAPSAHFAAPDRPRRLAAALPGIDRVFSEFRGRVHAPGVAYGVVVDGRLAHAAGVGVGDVPSGRAANATTIFRIASMTKSITAMCCLALRDQGRLGLDDPVVHHLPELAPLSQPTADGAPITLRQLLTMSAGLVTDDPWGDRQLAMPDDAFGAFLAQGVAFNRPAGLAYEYSNLGYAILGRVVSRVAGTPFAAVARDTVLRPLGMQDSHFEAAEVPVDRRANGYRWEDDTWVEEAPLADGAFGPMGGLWTSIEDFSRYLAVHLDAWPPRGGPETGPIRRSSIREMQQGQRLCWPPEDGGPTGPAAYGLGLVTSLHPRDGLTVAHSGGLPGYGSRVCFLPHHGVGVIGFANVTYAPVHEAVAAAIDLLAETGALRPRVEAPSDALVAAQAWAERLYAGWDEDEAHRLAAANLFADRSAPRRRRELEAMRSAHGARVASDPLIAQGSLRGGWRMRCERGSIAVTVILAPTAPPTVQTLELVPHPD